MTDNERELLPSTVRPIRHDLTLAPDLSTFTFEGKQTIDVEVLTSTSTIVMHSAEIEVGSTSLTLDDGTTLTPESIDYDTDLETVTLSFAEDLQAGPAHLSMSFTGELNDRLRGFYRSRYLDDAGNERHLATTQFEATDARRAFPCWDEPSWKAAFQDHSCCSLRTRGPVQHARGKRIGAGGRPQGGQLRRDAGHVHVHPGVRRGRPPEHRRTGPGRHPHAHLVHARQGGARPLRVGDFHKSPGVLQRILRHPIPASEDGPSCHSRLRGGRHGELGRDHLSRVRPARRPGRTARLVLAR